MKSAAALLFALVTCVCFAQESALKLAHRIPLNGVSGRFDHFAIDIQGKRLFVAALGNCPKRSRFSWRTATTAR